MDPIIKLAKITTTDSLTLPGLFFEPAKKTKKAAIYLHGNGSSGALYALDKITEIAKHLNKKGIAYLAFNNRGALLYHRLKYRQSGAQKEVSAGMAFELIKDCIKDIDAAIGYLQKQGYREIYLIGYSTGANKICVYNYYKPTNPVAKYILLGGGDDSGWYYKQFGKKKFLSMLKLSKSKIKQGKGEELVPKTILPYPYSYQALFDIMNPDGDYNTFPFWDVLHNLKLSAKQPFREYKSINKPTLVIYGSEDEYCYGRTKDILNLMKRECAHPDKFKFKIGRGQDHGFSQNPRQLAKTIAAWL
jgi:dienelactone hydrolase